jgi:hypothetical protein
MFNFLLGMLATIALIALCGFCYMLGRRTAKTSSKPITEAEKRKQDELSEMNEGYNKILNYSIEQAFKARRKDF